MVPVCPGYALQQKKEKSRSRENKTRKLKFYSYPKAGTDQTPLSDLPGCG